MRSWLATRRDSSIRLRTLAALLLCAGTPAAGANEQAAAGRQLESVQSEISRIEKQVRRSQASRQAVEQEIAELDQRIGTLAAQRRDIEAEVRERRASLAEVRGELTRSIGELDTHRRLLARQARLEYMSGRHSQLSLLLSGAALDELPRLLTWHGYVRRARAERMQQVDELIAALEDRRTDLERQREALSAARARLEQQDRELAQARAGRASRMAALGSEITGQKRELSRLEQESRRLEQLIEQLSYRPPDPAPVTGAAEVVADLPDKLHGRFADNRGQLPWPVAGKTLNRYGGKRGTGHLRWQGVMVGAPVGAPVRSVYHGRVAYADWLRGFGQLLIVDHGDGYMSLYGYNHQLLKQVGEWVQAGEAVARAGTAAGGASGVYFEVRRNGKPQDPARWCRG